MRATGTRRLIVVTASGHVRDPHDGFVIRILKPIVGRVLRHAFADFARTERIVADSGLDWTIMRPPRLTNGRPRPFRTALDHTVGTTVARTDLARTILLAAGDDTTVGHTVGVGY
jgi:hypothetical protein